MSNVPDCLDNCKAVDVNQKTDRNDLNRNAGGFKK